MSLVPKLDKNAAATEFKKIPSAQAGKEAGSSFNSSFGSVVKKIGGLVAFAEVGRAAAGLFSEAFNSAAEFEQLSGGVEKIFDEMDTSTIMADAQNAYKTMNMSANQYLSTINDVGATFAQTMGDEAGYNAAKKGLQAIADYASGTGKDVEQLSEKFTLITRSTSSYQSIADQFSGLLPATSEGFLEQAQACGFLSDEYESLSDVPIDEYQQAVTDMLEQGTKDMGLYQQTSSETYETVTGSLAGLKSAWANLVMDLGTGGENIGEDLAAVTEMFGYAAQNVIETVGNIFTNLGPLIEEQLPIVINNIVSYIRENGPTMLQTAIDFFCQIVTGIAQSLPTILAAIPDIIFGIVDAIWNNRGELVTAAGYLIEGLCEGLGAGIDAVIRKIQEICSGAIDAVKRFFGIASPSKVMMKMGGYIGEGMALGIESTASEITGAWDKAVSGIGDVTATVGINATKRNSNLGTNYSFGSITINVKSLEEMDSIDKFTTMLRRASMQYA